MNRTQSATPNSKNNEEKYEIYYVRKSKKKKENLCRTPLFANSYYVKVALLISALIIAFTVAAVCFFVYSSRSVAKEGIEKTDAAKIISKDNPKTISELIIYKNDKGLWSYNAANKKSKLLQAIQCEISSFDVYSEEIILWTDHCLPRLIRSTFKEYSSIAYPKQWIPKAIALDFVTSNVYVLDASSNSLNVINMESKNYAIVMLDLKNPHDLILDLTEAFVFVLQLGDSIIRCNKDGSSAKILPTPSISAMTIDRESKTIYWSIDYTSIESLDYEGRWRMKMMSIERKINSLAIVNRKLFMPELLQVTEDLIPHVTSMLLWYCRLHKLSCEKIGTDWISFDEPITSFGTTIMKAPIDSSQTFPADHCKNSDCDQLCLLAQPSGYRCLCSVGWQLNSDLRTCGLVTKSLLFVQGSTVRMKSLSATAGTSFYDVIVPIRIQQQIEDFDYNWISRTLYFSNGRDIYALNTQIGNEPNIIHSVDKSFNVRHLALDWRTKRLYFVKESRLPGRNHSIEVVGTKLGEKYQKTVLTLEYNKELQFKGCPYALILHNNRQQLYFTAYDSSPYDLQRINVNGTGLKPISQLRYYNDQKILAVDYQADRIYWILDRYDGEIRHADFNGQDQRAVKLEGLRNLKFLDLQDSWLYVGDGTSVWRFDKLTGGNATRVAPNLQSNNAERISVARVYSENNCKDC